jgi:hypothetical protein
MFSHFVTRRHDRGEAQTLLRIELSGPPFDILAAASSSLPLYRAGALLVTRSPVLAVCLAFTTRM